ncbi:conserved hypothetical protein [Verrucomicrobia bacterium]|nr:conserved hypothetical protein [Verrucomicrobiota bacterium]
MSCSRGRNASIAGPPINLKGWQKVGARGRRFGRQICAEPVAQIFNIFNLLYRRLVVGRAFNPRRITAAGDGFFELSNRRLKICDTANYKSALLGRRPAFVEHLNVRAVSHPAPFLIRHLLPLLLALATLQSVFGIQSPTGLVSRTGDQSIVLHWDPVSDPSLAGYRVYRSTTSNGGPFTLLTSSLLTSLGYCDVSGSVVDGHTNFYYVTSVTTASQESSPSTTLAAVPNPFVSTDAFLDYVQETCFDYFWYTANSTNGLVPDRSATGSACSIAAVGFGLTAIGIAIDHGWITRSQGVARVEATLNTFLQGPQGSGTSGVIGYNGWFYHFLNMDSALRSGTSELSSIDTTLLLAGVLYVKQYFSGTDSDETSIRTMADAIFNRVNWDWMARGTNAVSMAWYPETGFSANNWVGYNEGMIIYCLGLGTATNPLPASAWSQWTTKYNWATNYGQAYVFYPPLFVYQYSHCWIDFRHVADPYMNSHSSSYFINSRRAALAQVAYSIANPDDMVGYSSNVWGLTASDDPSGYAVHGLPPVGFDNDTIASTAAGGSMAFTPEYSLPTLQYFYSHYRARIWTAFSFRDAFNLKQGWYDTDELGIDQGPIVIMIENYRTQRVWQLFMQNAEAQRGLERAGFTALPSVPISLQAIPAQGAFNVSWNATAGQSFQVEYSPDLQSWYTSPLGFVQATNSGTFNWLDAGPPATLSIPATNSERFYRVYQLGTPAPAPPGAIAEEGSAKPSSDGQGAF